MSDLREAAQALLDKLDAAKKAMDDVCLMSQIHGAPYSGPTIGPEKEALRAALSAEPAQPKALMDADELTDEQIESALKGAGINIGLDDGTPGYRFIMMAAFNAVVAADRASRLPEMGAGDWPELPPPTFPADERSPDLWDVGVLRHIQRTAVEAYKALVRGKT